MLQDTERRLSIGIVAATAAILLLAGSAEAASTVTPVGTEATRDSPGYGDGYVAGCRRGNSDAGLPQGYSVDRDESRYASDSGYRKGWDDGYAFCLRSGAHRRLPY